MLSLHQVKPNPGARRKAKRLGLGEASGSGKTSGRGGKGQTARKGGKVRAGFEGGQMPLYRRLPKYGFVSRAKLLGTNKFVTVNVGLLDKVFTSEETVSIESLRAKGVVKSLAARAGIKVLAEGDVTKKLKLQVQAVSQAAKDKIEKAGGVVEIHAASRLSRISKSKAP